MNAQARSTSSAETPSNSTILHGGWLWLARLLWLVFIIIALAIFIRGIPLRAETMRNGYRPAIGVNPYWNKDDEIAVWQWWDYPAFQAGILDGDTLVAVNGVTPDLKPGDILDGLIPNNAAGTPITLTVRTGNHPAREYKLFYGGENAVALAQLGILNDFMANYAIAIEISFALIYLGIAGIIFVRRSNDWLALLASLSFVLVSSIIMYNSVYDAEPFWRPMLDIWSAVMLFTVLLFLYLFPVGQNVPRWIWVFVLAAGVYTVLYCADPSIHIWALPRPWGFLIFLGWFSSGMFTQVYHYRHSNPIQKQQTKWVLFGIAAMLVGIVGQLAAYNWGIPAGLPTVLFDLVGYPAIQLLKLFLPITIAIAILRYRLWDIDIIINRTLVYGTLTAAVVALYVLIVGWSSIGLQTRNNLAGSVFAILAIAFLLQPLRQRLQSIVDRFVPVPQSALRAEQHKHKLAIPESQGTADTTLHGRWLLVARLAWVAMFTILILLYTLGFVEVRKALSTVCEEELCTLSQQIRHIGVGEQVMNFRGPDYADRLRPDQVKALETLGLRLDQYGWLGALQMGIAALVFLLIAAGLFWQKSDNWMVLFVSMMVATTPLWAMPLPFTLAVRQPAWEWVVGLAFFVSQTSNLTFPLIFPTGQFVPRWTRWMLPVALVYAAFWSFYRPLVDHPRALGFVIATIVIFGFISLYAQVYRYFRVASPLERQQLKWIVVGYTGFLCTALLVVLPLNELLTSRAESMDPARALILSAIMDTLALATTLFSPVAIVISVLRYRLWDIDILINRTMVYGALTGFVVSAFVIIVGFLSILFQSSGNSIIAIIATGLASLLFNPLRQRLQRGVNHLMYGERDDPYVVLSQLGQRLETVLTPTAILSTIVETIGRTLKLPCVEIRLKDDQTQSVSFGEHQARTIAFPLAYQNESVGELHVAPRAGESLSSADHNLLKDLARQTGIAIHAAQVTVDLQRSRERLVLAREEERRRLRRDLHDDLAPTLASLGLTASTAADMISTNPITATRLVKELQTEIRATVGNIRRLVYDLRPPTLDELGLFAAIRERATQYSNAPEGFHVTLDAPAELPALPAAIEVAAYRIVQEALENVSKHSKARTCSIRFANHNGLEIEITDDGIGLPLNITPGVGLRSMRERAEELGGSCVIERGVNSGTRILARFPMGEFDGSVTRIDR